MSKRRSKHTRRKWRVTIPTGQATDRWAWQFSLFLTGKPIPRAEAVANARLMMAAPRMYALLAHIAASTEDDPEALRAMCRLLPPSQRVSFAAACRDAAHLIHKLDQGEKP